MHFNEDLPKWEAQGTSPSTTLQNSGFIAGYKPPAAFFNWLFNRIYKSIRELRSKALDLSTIREVSLDVNAWQGEGEFFKQEVNILGIMDDDAPVLVKRLDPAIQNNSALVKAYNKYFSLIFAGETKNGSVVLWAYKKPRITFKVGLKGV